MKIKFLKPYGMYGVGDKADLPSPIAELLIQRKVAEMIPEPVETKRRGRPKMETKLLDLDTPPAPISQS